MKVYLDPEEDVVSSNIFRTSQANTGSRCMFLLTVNHFNSISSKIYAGGITHTPGLPVPTQAVLDLIDPIISTNRNITTDDYDTSVSLAKELKSNKITLVDFVGFQFFGLL